MQRFTTGASEYILTSTEIKSEDTQGDDAAVSAYTVNGSGYPDSLVATLTPPGSFARGTLVFASPKHHAHGQHQLHSGDQ